MYIHSQSKSYRVYLGRMYKKWFLPLVDQFNTNPQSPQGDSSLSQREPDHTNIARIFSRIFFSLREICTWVVPRVSAVCCWVLCR